MQQMSVTNPNRREVLNSRQQRRKTAQSTRFNTLMQDYAGSGFREGLADLGQSYGKTMTTSMALDTN